MEGGTGDGLGKIHDINGNPLLFQGETALSTFWGRIYPEGGALEHVEWMGSMILTNQRFIFIGFNNRMDEGSPYLVGEIRRQYRKNQDHKMRNFSYLSIGLKEITKNNFTFLGNVMLIGNDFKIKISPNKAFRKELRAQIT